MKWLLVAGLLACLFLLSYARPTSAAINRQINFQGKIVLSSNSTNITNGTYNMQFKIYSGGDGVVGGGDETLLWTEDHLRNASQGVALTDGVFQVNLGAITALPGSIDFNSSTIWLSINLGNTNASCTPFASCSGDGEMSPMVRFTAAPYAINSDLLDGLDSAAFGQLAQNQTWTGTQTLQPTSNITSAIVKQTSAGSPTADIFNVQTANSTNVLQITGPAANEAAVTLQSVGATRALTLNSGSGTIVLGTATTTLQKSGTTFSFDLNNAANSTFTITNAAAGVASLNVEGSISTTTTVNANDFDRTTTGTLTVGNTNTTLLSLCNSANCDTVQIANNADIDTVTIGDSTDTVGINGAVTVLGAVNINNSGTSNTTIGGTAGGTITIGAASGSDLALNDAQWSVTGAGVASFAGLTSTGTINLGSVGTSTASSTVHVADTTNATGTQLVTIGSTANTANKVTIQGGGAASGIVLQTAASGGIDIGVNNVASKTINIGSVGTTAATSTIHIADSNAAAQTLTLGSTNTTSTTTLQSGSGNINLSPSAGNDVVFSQGAGSNLQISASAAPTVDQVFISNAGQGTTTAGVNGLGVNYVGGNAAVESAGIRVDYTPGGTSGGTWSGMRIVANTTGAVGGVTEYGLKIEGPGTPGAGQETGIYIGTGWDIGLDVQSGGIQLDGVTNEPSAPAAGNLLVYSKDVAGRMLLKAKGPSGLDTPYQPALFFNAIAFAVPSTGTTVTAIGMNTATVGTASTPTISTGSLANSMRRTRVTSSATANSASELRSSQLLVWRGNSANLGGFFYTCRFSINSTTTNQRLFVGLTSATGATSTSQNPSSLTNMLGVGWDSADANLQIMGNDAAGTATKTDAGASFPTNTTAAVYEFVMFAAPNGSSVGWRLTRLDTGAETSGSITNSADLPSSTTFLTHHEYMNNGGTAASVVLDVMRVYIESDY